MECMTRTNLSEKSRHTGSYRGVCLIFGLWYGDRSMRYRGMRARLECERKYLRNMHSWAECGGVILGQSSRLWAEFLSGYIRRIGAIFSSGWCQGCRRIWGGNYLFWGVIASEKNCCPTRKINTAYRRSDYLASWMKVVFVEWDTKKILLWQDPRGISKHGMSTVNLPWWNICLSSICDIFLKTTILHSSLAGARSIDTQDGGVCGWSRGAYDAWDSKEGIDISEKPRHPAHIIPCLAPCSTLVRFLDHNPKKYWLLYAKCIIKNIFFWLCWMLGCFRWCRLRM